MFPQWPNEIVVNNDARFSTQKWEGVSITYMIFSLLLCYKERQSQILWEEKERGESEKQFIHLLHR